jgi:hypothetical protein
MFRNDNKYNLPLLLEEIARTVIATHQPNKHKYSNIHEKIESEKKKKERSLNR